MNQEIYERLLNISERLKREYNAEKVILFGSYARGEETIDSDVDILVIAPTKERMIDRMASVSRIIRKLRNGLPISPIVLTPEEFRRKLDVGDAFIQTVVEEGVVL
ncbi:MAG: nucleotidyltransferase domain-containing protein [Deltaproteobacteria bacterium]|nr:MAG: nucleotidyltransferase domain-containing protein [Deltaproteobacteria bacterium]